MYCSARQEFNIQQRSKPRTRLWYARLQQFTALCCCWFSLKLVYCCRKYYVGNLNEYKVVPSHCGTLLICLDLQHHKHYYMLRFDFLYNLMCENNQCNDDGWWSWMREAARANLSWKRCVLCRVSPNKLFKPWMRYLVILIPAFGGNVCQRNLTIKVLILKWLF